VGGSLGEFVFFGAGSGRCCVGAAKGAHRPGGRGEILRRSGVRTRLAVAIRR